MVPWHQWQAAMNSAKPFFTPRADTVAWYVAVPVLTNRVLSLEVCTVLAMLLPLSGGFVLLVQFMMGGHVTPEHLAVALRAGGYITGGGLLAYLLTGGVILKNRYLAFYELTDSHIRNDIMRADEPFSFSAFRRTRPWAASPPREPGRTVSRTLPLRDVRTINLVPSLNLIKISTRDGGGFMKVYCATPAMFHTVSEHLSGISGVHAQGV